MTKEVTDNLMLRRSRVLRDLRSGSLSACAKINLSDPRAIDICGMIGIPSVWICNEHIPNDWLNLENQIRAANRFDMDTIIRVSRGSYSDYIKPFEADATAIMVPHVETADEARQIVEWTRFYPQGNRPIDGGNIDGRYGTLDMQEYIDYSNREKFIILQIESPLAVNNVDEIATVDGFDMLLFGASDFTHRAGYLGDFDHPDLLKARQRVARAALANNKVAMYPGYGSNGGQLESEGFRFFGIGADVAILAEGIKLKWQNFNELHGPAS